MKVLVVSPLPPPSGGIATWTEGLCNYFQGGREGVSIVVLNTSLTGHRAEVVSNHRNFWDEIKRTWKLLRAFRRMLREEKPDVIHLNSSGAQFGMYRDWLMACAAHRVGVPVVVHFRCDVQNKAEFNSRAFRAFHWLVKKADRVLVLNHASLEYAKRFTQAPVEVVFNYCAHQGDGSVAEIRETLRKVVFVGQVRESKGINELLEAAEGFPDIEFHLVGKVYEDYEKGTLPSNVKLHGSIEHDQVRKELLSADLFVLPSYTEGFSNALVEAMAVGLPCIATEVGANADMLSGECGVVMPPRSSKDLADAIARLKDQETRKRFSQNARRKYLDNYTLDAVTRNLMRVWRQTVQTT